MFWSPEEGFSPLLLDKLTNKLCRPSHSSALNFCTTKRGVWEDSSKPKLFRAVSTSEGARKLLNNFSVHSIKRDVNLVRSLCDSHLSIIIIKSAKNIVTVRSQSCWALKMDHVHFYEATAAVARAALHVQNKKNHHLDSVILIN